MITPDMLELVMHSSLKISGTEFNFSNTKDPLIVGNAICFNIFMDSPEKVTAAYELLKINGQIVVDLGPQFFSQMYAFVVDKFGIKWQLLS